MFGNGGKTEMRITMTTAYSQPLSLLITLIFTVMMVNGCAFLNPGTDGTMDADRSKIDKQALEDAIASYENDEFEHALIRFEELGNASNNERIKRKARLGEICSRLMLADTQGEFISAVDMWRDFIKEIPAEHDGAWAIPLIDPLIVRMAPKLTTQVVEIKPPPENQNKEKSTEPKQRPEKQDKNRKKPTTKGAAAQDEADLKSQVESLKKENQQLKEKIKALEAIDQDIQEKKTKLSAPSE